MARNSVDERTLEIIERTSERIGMREGKNANEVLKKHIKEILREIGVYGSLYDIKEDCCKTILYFGGTMCENDRNRLLSKLTEKTGTLPESYKIVAFYN